MGKVKKEKKLKSVQVKKEDADCGKQNKCLEKKKTCGDEGARKYGYISSDSVISMAESAGFSSLSDDVAKSLAEDVTYRLRYIIQQCKKFLIHSKHKRLKSCDINQVLKLCDVPALYGYTCESSAHDFIYIREADVFVLNDQYVDLPSLALSEDFVRRKLPITATGNWLKQEESNKAKVECKGKQGECKNSEAEVEGTKSVVEGSQKSCGGPTESEGSQSQAQMQTRIPTHLIKYYGVTCNFILGHSQLKMIFEDLSKSSRIVAIVPYLLNFITIALNKLNSERQLKRLLQTVEALSRNESVDLSPYSATTRVVNAMLLIVASEKKTEKMTHDFRLRFYGARVLASVLSRWCFRDEQRSVVVKKMGKLVCDLKTSPKILYGAILLLTFLGPEALNESLWTALPQFLTYLQELKLGSNSSTENEAFMLEQALLEAAVCFYSYPTNSSSFLVVDRLLSDHFGDSLCNLKQNSASRFQCLEAETPEKEKSSEEKVFWKALKYMNSRYKADIRKHALGTVFALPVPRKRKNTKIIFKFAGAIPVPEVSLKRRRFQCQYAQFIAGKESEGHVVLAGKCPPATRTRRLDPSFPYLQTLL